MRRDYIIGVEIDLRTNEGRQAECYADDADFNADFRCKPEKIWYSGVMTTVEMTLQLPDRLARQAEDAGLLSPERIVDLIEREIERQQVIDRLFGAMDSLAAVDQSPLDEADIAEEVQAVRRARRS